MNIKVLYAKTKKVEEEDIGYTVQFLNPVNNENLECPITVIIGSHIDTFLKLNKGENIRVILVDDRVIALADRDFNIELARDVVKSDLSGREADGNIKYIKEKYGMSVDILETTILEAIKDDCLGITPLIVDDESHLIENGLGISLEKDKTGTLVICPKDTEIGNFILKSAGVTDGNFKAALDNLMGREFYVIDFALEVIALVDKETKEICILRDSYDLNGNYEKGSNLKRLEERGIAPDSLDLRVKRLVNNEERSK